MMVNRRKEITEEEAKKVIPNGVYCYDYKDDEYRRCPFLEIRRQEENGVPYEDGYCHWLEMEDLLLWDACKLCGINDEIEFDEEGNEVE